MTPLTVPADVAVVVDPPNAADWRGILPLAFSLAASVASFSTSPLSSWSSAAASGSFFGSSLSTSPSAWSSASARL